MAVTDHECEFRDKLAEALGRELVLHKENERLQKHAVSIIDGMRAENAFLVRLIRGEGSRDMIEIMEHFLGGEE